MSGRPDREEKRALEVYKIGVGILGYFGLGLEYEDDWVGRYYVHEVTLQALGFQPALAYRVTGWLSIGAGVVALYGVLDEKVAINNIDPNRGDGRLKIHAEDTTRLTADRN